MDTQIISSIISAGTTILVSGIFFYVFNRHLNQQQKRLNLELERVHPSHQAIFEDNRIYLQILWEAREKFYEIFFNQTKKLFIDKRLSSFNNPHSTDNIYVNLNDKERSFFKKYLEEHPEHSKFRAIYLMSVEFNRFDNQFETERKINILENKIPFIHPEIRKAGEKLLGILFNFEDSDPFTSFLDLLDDNAKTEWDILRLLYDFELETKEKIDQQFYNIERLLLEYYNVS